MAQLITEMKRRKIVLFSISKSFRTLRRASHKARSFMKVRRQATLS